jgi:hypothetical protein
VADLCFGAALAGDQGLVKVIFDKKTAQLTPRHAVWR